MRASIGATFLCALFLAGIAASPSAAQSTEGVRVATATPTVTPAPKFTFILFWKEDNAATQAMAEALKRAVAERSQRAEWTSVNITDGSQRPIVDRYHVERAPMPMVLCVAPNGVVTGGVPRQLNDAAIEKMLVTPAMTEVTKALQDKRIVVIHLNRDPGATLPAGAAGFAADPSFKDRTAIVNIGLGDPAEIEALRARAPAHPALEKYAQAGRLLSRNGTLDQDAAHAALVDTLTEWTQALGLPTLAHYGVAQRDIPHIVAHSRGSSMKTNPIALDDAEIAAIVAARL